jgi:H+-transporting ATPase
VILESNFFQNKFNVNFTAAPNPTDPIDHNDRQLHTIVYLQVAIISQALIFVTRSHGFFFMERPSYALMGAFCLAQLVSSIIAGFANWEFTYIQKISSGWIGIVWVWVCFYSSLGS